MKRTKISFQPMKIIIFSMVLLFFGCSKEKDGQIPKGEKINFKINIKNDKEKKATLNPTSSTDFTTSFKVGDEIGVFATPTGTALLASGNPINNVKLTYDGTGWVGDIDWPNIGGSFDFYAYYPYGFIYENPLQMTFVSNFMNAGMDRVSQSDLMSGTVQGVVKGGDVELEFTHRLALLQVEVSKGAGLGTGPYEALEVYLNTDIGKGNLNLSNNSFQVINESYRHSLPRLEKLGSPDYSTKFTYRTYLPAQDLPNSQEIINLITPLGSKNYLLPNVVQLRAGVATVIKLDFLIE